LITFEDFEKTDIRIGTVIDAEVPEWSHWVMGLTVDLGEEVGIKKAFSGIMKFYKPEDLESLTLNQKGSVRTRNFRRL